MNPLLLAEVQKTIAAHCLSEVRIISTHAVGGGSINSAFRIVTNRGDFFLKYNNAEKYPAMFDREALGLRLLAESKTLRVPEVIATGSDGTHDFLLLEFLERGSPVKDFWEDFGSALAAMHGNTSESFGLQHDNYIGSLPQSNAVKKDFITFFIENRLQPQLEMAVKNEPQLKKLVPAFEQLFKRLPGIIPEEKPALLHGDLWSGNFLIGPEGKACIIDPAVYYGHREADLAMSKLFGGFDEAFYAGYHEAFPLEKGWEKRVELFNLYPLLVHVNLFGGGYVQQVESIVARY